MTSLEECSDHDVRGCPHYWFGWGVERLSMDGETDAIGVDDRIVAFSCPSGFAGARQTDGENEERLQAKPSQSGLVGRSPDLLQRRQNPEPS